MAPTCSCSIPCARWRRATALLPAWLLARSDNIVPIRGIRRSAYLVENLGAIGLTLSAAELALLGVAMAPGAVQGARYVADGMAAINA